MLRTINVCSKCGETTTAWETTDDWLIGSSKAKAGQMVIRCPQHITRYAIRQAGGHIANGLGIVGNWAYYIIGKKTNDGNQ